MSDRRTGVQRPRRGRFADRYGSWALVAGASVGLGAAFARALAERGMNLVLVARRKPLLDALAGELRGRFGVEVRCLDVDLATPDAPENLRGAMSGLDVGLLVWNAAHAPVGDFVDVEGADLLRAVDVNVRGPVALLRTFLPPMVVRGRGGVVLYCCLFCWFLVDYLVFERVHLYTYDIFAERVGFKLGWGCLAFYPYFYAVGLWVTAGLPDPHTASWLLVVYACVFLAGWTISRGANMQKFFFKIDPERALLGIIKPRTLNDGKRALLCSGFWGAARHVNYLGEILMATGLTLALGWPALWPAWLYPLYYVALLLARERADDRRCAAKYGALWTEYVRRVPRRIIPGLY